MRRLAVLFLALAGCSADPSMPNLSAYQQPIIGGTTDTGDPSVVLLIAQMPNSQSASLCTAEVVSPHVILSAAHCVDPAIIGQGNQFFVFLGDDITNSAQMTKANFANVQETHFDSQFDMNNLQGGHDVSAIILSSPINRTPLPMNRSPLTNAMDGANLRLVGFGIDSGTDTMGTSAGIKRQVTTPLTQFDNSFLYFGNSTMGTCEGDSGGPAFMTINGQEVIAGITSFGAMGCTMGSADTRVDVYATAFVDPYIQMFDGTGAPDLATPPDMASSGSGGAGGSPAPGTVGATCSGDSDCQSGICAKTGDSMYCTTPCDPANKMSCPSSLTCGSVDNQHYCVKQSSGCDMTGGHAPVGGALILFALLGLALAARRRFV